MSSGPSLRNRPFDRALRVGLTGGIGSGKSTVAALLAERGATVVDADEIAREVVEPGTPGLAAIVAEFGDEVLLADGSLNRKLMGERVFAAELERERLEKIVLPLIASEAAARLSEVPAGQVAVYDMPLLAESEAAGLFDFVIVVESPLKARLERLDQRGVGAADALARIANQATDEERRAVASVVISNAGTEEDLAQAAAQVWDEFLA